MTNGETRPEAAVRDAAAEVARLASEVATLRGHMEAMESRLRAASAAHVELAGQVEHLAADKSVAQLEETTRRTREETAGWIRAQRAEIDASVAESRATSDKAASDLGRVTTGHEQRLEAIEDELRRAEATHRLEALRHDVAGLAETLRAAEGRIDALEVRPPRPDPPTVRRVDDLEGGLSDVRHGVATWQKHLEDGVESTRRIEQLARDLNDQAAAIAEAHHATSEAQRLAEEWVRDALARAEQASETRWAELRTMRSRDADRVARAAEARDEALAELRAALAGVEAALEKERAAALERDEQRIADIGNVRRTVVKVLDALKGGLEGAASVAEEGVPYEERSDVIEERQRAIRRALRAQRSEP